MSSYSRWLRPFLFRLDPERAHELTIGTLALVQRSFAGRALLKSIRGPVRPRPVRLFGLTFPNVLGVAAGFDKDARAVPALAQLGFGHVEIGTLTPGAQEGNPRPRIFRLPQDKALINRMGFPNQGAAAATARLHSVSRSRQRPIVGASLGKQRDTPLEKAVADYRRVMSVVYPFVDYLAVNISSPNTPGLRRLQQAGYLEELLETVSDKNLQLAAAQPEQKTRPLLLKIAPDVSLAQLDEILIAAESTKIDGLIIANTTTAREGLNDPNRKESGGLSGRPLAQHSTALIRHAARETQGRLPIVGVGGVFTVQDVRDKLVAGASLVQLYTGLIYEGPGLAGRLLRGLDQLTPTSPN